MLSDYEYKALFDMYQAFFGLKDKPFSIAPNPFYLFLSDRHREALAHLSYGLGETGGFVLLTGEVGTGKTTVSRTLLKQLPHDTDTAFILNPALTELELLATLCDELGIDYGDNPTLKQLTDRISTFLLNNHQKGRNTLLIIDEAQHLKAEVLEQLRLLTNLETDTKKLLQVILIGQPELQALLKRQELRQLAQRITARYHLLPLSEKEVALYVQHRLHVAGRDAPLFTKKAIQYLHQKSGGIPRLINLICERALMAGYAKSTALIDRKIIQQAAQEVFGEPESQPISSYKIWLIPLFIVVLAGAYFGFRNHDIQPLTIAQSKPLETVATKTDADKTHDDKSQILKAAIAESRDIKTAFSVLLGLWGKKPYKNLTSCQAAQLQGLACHQQQGNWTLLMKMNYPAVVYLNDQQNRPFYGTLIERNGDKLLLQLGEQQLWISKAWFNQHYTGTFELLWEKPPFSQKEINQSASREDAQWLENQLAKIDHRSPRTVNYMDVKLKKNLMTFQQKLGLIADGIVGSQTFAQLNIYGSLQGPRLSEELQ